MCRSVKLIELFNESPKSLLSTDVEDDMFNDELSSQFVVVVVVVDFRDGIMPFVGDGDRGGLLCNSLLLLSELFIYEHTNKLSVSLKLPSGDIVAILLLCREEDIFNCSSSVIVGVTRRVLRLATTISRVLQWGRAIAMGES